MILSTSNPTPASLADWSDVAALQQKMVDAIASMSAAADAVGIAKHVIEYDSDLRKRALARAMAAPLAGGASAAKAESEARSSESYNKEMQVRAKQHEAAMIQVEHYQCLKLEWETARSLLSLQKETIRQL